MNIWEDFLENNPDIQKKLDGLIEPIAKMVDEAIQYWTAKPRDKIFESTPEYRNLMVEIAKKAASSQYQEIENTAFFQYIRAFELYLYLWLLEIQKQEIADGKRDKMAFFEIFNEIISEAFRLGYALRELKPPNEEEG